MADMSDRPRIPTPPPIEPEDEGMDLRVPQPRNPAFRQPLRVELAAEPAPGTSRQIPLQDFEPVYSKNHKDEMTVQMVLSILGYDLRGLEREELERRIFALEQAFARRYGRFWSDIVNGRLKLELLTANNRKMIIPGFGWKKQ
ncbi:Oidioi.mRNA.OKI2018_I69.chr2.g7960.t1.cds [Oikopleura dioica]|uniref:Oidioi.mRNA.OKI2018_I69.chr2.g7960.t1.cds n=1 Tax=Oikopleura dioica TaxID=34765 RepID=A0ABN7TE86_OIKDI|nr:Oidioi.mRNA.OKI2018_I69.chr2.g7960.t1.cds [Oikopleura dioica]